MFVLFGVLAALWSTAALKAAPQAVKATPVAFDVRASVEYPIIGTPGRDFAGWSFDNVAPDGSGAILLFKRADIKANVQLVRLYWLPFVGLSGSSLNEAGMSTALKLVKEYRLTHSHQVPTRFRWSSPRELDFVALDGNNVLQAHRLDVGTLQIRQLTRSPTDVQGFAMLGERYVYWAFVPLDHSPRNAAGFAPGMLLVPNEATARVTPLIELFVEEDGVRRSLGYKMRVASPHHTSIWPSPDGRKLVAYAQQTDWPDSWSAYRMVEPGFDYHPNRRYPQDPTTPNHMIRMQLKVHDVECVTSKWLVDAPGGYLAQNLTPPVVGWREDGRSVVVTNTFRPIGPEPSQSILERPATVEVKLGETPVTIFEEPTYAERRADSTVQISRVEFGRNGDRIDVVRSGGRRQCFSKSSGAWREVPAETPATEAKKPGLELRQGLNQPPLLVVTPGAGVASEVVVMDTARYFAKFELTSVSTLTWRDREGVDWKAGFVPAAKATSGPVPVVIQTHGYSDQHFLVNGYSDWPTAFAARALSAAGFAVVQMEDHPHRRKNLEKEDAMQAEGMRALVDHLVTHKNADPKRIGAIGFSRSGSYVLELITRHPDLVRAAILSDSGMFTFSSMVVMIDWTSTFRPQMLAARGMSEVEDNPEVWFAKDRTRTLGQVNTAIRFEAIVPESVITHQHAYAIRRAYGKPVEMVYFPDDTHVLFRPSNIFDSQSGTVSWFKKWLGGQN